MATKKKELNKKIKSLLIDKPIPDWPSNKETLTSLPDISWKNKLTADDVNYLKNMTDYLDQEQETTKTNIVNLQTSLDETNGNVTTLQSSLETTNTNVASLTSRVSVNEGNITNLQSGLATANTNVTNLTTRVTNNETQIAGKQNLLVSGTNIKTVDNQTLLGSGNLNTKFNLNLLGFLTYTAGSGITYIKSGLTGFDTKRPFGISISSLADSYGLINMISLQSQNQPGNITREIKGTYNSRPSFFYNVTGTAYNPVITYNASLDDIGISINTQGSFTPGLLGTWVYTTGNASGTLYIFVYQ